MKGFTKTIQYTPLWIKKDFMACSPGYREIRRQSINQLISCFKCNHKYIDGEMMGIAYFNQVGNKTLCQDCTTELLDES